MLVNWNVMVGCCLTKKMVREQKFQPSLYSILIVDL